MAQRMSAMPVYSQLVWYMMQPAVLTLEQGLQAHNFSTTVGEGPINLLQDRRISTFGPGDVFVWVGVANLEWRLSNGQSTVYAILKDLTARGVLTVFYSTETFTAMTCEAKRRLPVREIWEYTHTNVLCCPGTPSGLRVRYVPPGYTRRTSLAGSDLRTSQRASPKLIFLGSPSPWYWMRRRCLVHVAGGLTDQWTLRALEPAARFSPQCAATVCERCNTTLCPLVVKQSITDDGKWDEVVASSQWFLNIHKVCDWALQERDPDLQSNASCESFRLASLLSAGAEVFSEHCHPHDEREYDGLVHFLPVSTLAQAATSAWHTGRKAAKSDVRDRAARFAARFDPRILFARAGLSEALATHQRTASESLPESIPSRITQRLHTRELHLLSRETMADMRRRLPDLPQFCCLTEAECHVNFMLTHPAIRGNMTLLLLRRREEQQARMRRVRNNRPRPAR